MNIGLTVRELVHVEQRPQTATKVGESPGKRRFGASQSASTPVPEFSADIMETIANLVHEPCSVARLQSVSKTARAFYLGNAVSQRTTLRVASFIEARYPTRAVQGSVQTLRLLKGAELEQLADANALRFRAHEQITRSLEHVISSNDRTIATFDVIALAKDHDLPKLASAVEQYSRPGMRECFRFNGFVCRGDTFIAPDQQYRQYPEAFINEIRSLATDPHEYPMDRLPVYNKALSIFPQLRPEDRQTIVDLSAATDRGLNVAPLQIGGAAAGLIRCWDHLSESQKHYVVGGLLGEPDPSGFFGPASIQHHRVLRACVEQYAKLPDLVQLAVVNRLTDTNDCINELPIFLSLLTSNAVDDTAKATVLDHLLNLMDDRSARGATRWEMGIADRGCGAIAEALIKLGDDGPKMNMEQTATCIRVRENLQTMYPGLNLLSVEEADAFRNFEPRAQANHVRELLDINRPLTHRSQRSVHARILHPMFGTLTPDARIVVLADILREDPEKIAIQSVERLFERVQHISEPQFRSELNQATALASTLRAKYPQRRRDARSLPLTSRFEDA